MNNLYDVLKKERVNMFQKLFIILFIAVLISCKSKTEQTTAENLDPNTHKVVVEEVIQAQTYTYLQVEEKDKEYWIATGKGEFKEDDILYYTTALEMKNFESKDLKRTFDTIYFVDKMSDKPVKSMTNMITKSPHQNIQSKQAEDIKVTPVKDGVTIAELYSHRDDYKGKSVKIRGQVVKFNREIMGRNWVHIQDGTKYENNFDLTITTAAVVKKGDVVTFEGKITLDKDFGAGYSYSVVMEEAKEESTILN